jgi:hypothetical protein
MPWRKHVGPNTPRCLVALSYFLYNTLIFRNLHSQIDIRVA